jgi:MFS family permease
MLFGLVALGADVARLALYWLGAAVAIALVFGWLARRPARRRRRPRVEDVRSLVAGTAGILLAAVAVAAAVVPFAVRLLRL